MKSAFCKGETHTPEELFTVLRKKHRASSKRRKKDTKKMDEMQHSIKKRDPHRFQEAANQLASVQCPMEKYKARQALMTKRWIVRPAKQAKSEEAKSEGEQKEERNSIPEEVVNAYLVALKALGCKGNSYITFDETNPW